MGDNLTKGIGVEVGDNNGEYHRLHLPYSFSSQIEANAMDKTKRHLKEVNKRQQRVGRSIEYI